jgi:hypothetical protein
MMPGGIQPGMVATDAHARKLDNQLKESAKNIKFYFEENDRVLHQRKLRQDQIPGGKGACEPDGGVWFIDGELVAVFEAKKQNLKGNAIERWFKNNAIVNAINPKASYVTFAVGAGAQEDKVIGKTLNVVHPHGFNNLVIGDNSTFLNAKGFDDEFIMSTMLDVIEAHL